MKIISICPECLGTGSLPVGETYDVCGRCLGKGTLDFGSLEIDSITTNILDDLQKCKNRLKKIMDKLEISE